MSPINWCDGCVPTHSGGGHSPFADLHSPTGGNAVAFTDPRPATVKDDALQLKPGFYTKEERIFRGTATSTSFWTISHRFLSSKPLNTRRVV